MLDHFESLLFQFGMLVSQSAKVIELEQVQKRALQIIRGQIYSDYDKPLQFCDIPTLKQHRFEICLRSAGQLLTSNQV